MRPWSTALVVVGMVSGCKYGPYEFACTDDASCGPGGTCQLSNHFCSFSDTSCPSGQRYGNLGRLSGTCAARLCYGAAPFSVCFATTPTGTIDVSSATTFDTVSGTITGTPLTCTSPRSGGTGYCVLAADTITISAPLRAVGTNPLVLVAATSISVPTSIDVGSHRTPSESIGAGAAPAIRCNAGTLPNPGANGNGGGGGAGGSFIGNGGNGSDGAAISAAGGKGGQPGSAVTAVSVSVIRGGCPGQGGSGSAGSPGHGGGAVFLIAGSSITVGGTINAGGEGGAGGNPGAGPGGGGGGGAGGMIGFDAPTIMVAGALSANGGGGGGGGNDACPPPSCGGGGCAGGVAVEDPVDFACNDPGAPGSDAVSTAAAAGGDNGGGAGSVGVAGGAGANGTTPSFGGGGGGGAGLINGPPALLGTNVSPAATP